MPHNDDETKTSGLPANELSEIQTGFDQFDEDHNGYITDDGMRRCLERHHILFSDLDIRSVVSQMDNNRDGQISYDEYMKFMTKLYRKQTPRKFWRNK